MPSGTGAARGSMLLDAANMSRINADTAYKDIPLNDAIRQIKMNQANVELRPDAIANLDRQKDMQIRATQMDQRILQNRDYVEQNMYKLKTDTTGQVAQDMAKRFDMGLGNVSKVNLNAQGQPESILFDNGTVVDINGFIDYAGGAIDRADDTVKGARGILSATAKEQAERRKMELETGLAIKEDAAKQRMEEDMRQEGAHFARQQQIFEMSGPDGVEKAYNMLLRADGFTESVKIKDDVTGEEKIVLQDMNGKTVSPERANELRQQATEYIAFMKAWNNNVLATGKGNPITYDEAVSYVQSQKKAQKERLESGQGKAEQWGEHRGKGVPVEGAPYGTDAPSKGEQKYRKETLQDRILQEEIRRQQEDERRIRESVGQPVRRGGIPGIDVPRR